MSIYTHVRYEYIQYTVLLLPFQQCQTRLSCGDSDYFWDSVAAPCIYGMAACMFLCVTLYYRAGHATTVPLQRVLGDKIASYCFLSTHISCGLLHLHTETLTFVVFFLSLKLYYVVALSFPRR